MPCFDAQRTMRWRDQAGHRWLLHFYFVDDSCVGMEVNSIDDPAVAVTGTVLRQIPFASLSDWALRKPGVPFADEQRAGAELKGSHPGEIGLGWV